MGKVRTASKRQLAHIARLAELNKKDPARKERCRLLGYANQGRKHSAATKAKLSQMRRGCVSNNKGKTYEEIYGKEKAVEIKRSIGGHVPWNKGLVGVYSEATKKAISDARLAEFKTEDACQLYKQGLSMKEVALALGCCSATAVWRRLAPLGVLRDRGSGNRGRQFTSSHRKAISAGQKLLRNLPEVKDRLCNGENNPFYGKRHKPETIEAMKVKVSLALSGENNPHWLGGKSLEPYGPEFNEQLKKDIRERDNHQCQVCGIPDLELLYSLIVHHIDYDKRNNDWNNLVSLCRPCHMRTNFHRDYWADYFQSKEVSPC